MHFLPFTSVPGQSDGDRETANVIGRFSSVIIMELA